MEKEQLRQRHQELLHQEQILKSTKDGSSSSSHAQLQGDPYLSSLATSDHARQGSTDSGLGGATPYHPEPNSMVDDLSEMDTGALRFSPYHSGARGPPNHNIELVEPMGGNNDGDAILDSTMDTQLQPSIGSEFLDNMADPSGLYWV